jgi:hypothetical protein
MHIVHRFIRFVRHPDMSFPPHQIPPFHLHPHRLRSCCHNLRFKFHSFLCPEESLDLHRACLARSSQDQGCHLSTRVPVCVYCLSSR